MNHCFPRGLKQLWWFGRSHLFHWLELQEVPRKSPRPGRRVSVEPPPLRKAATPAGNFQKEKTGIAAQRRRTARSASSGEPFDNPEHALRSRVLRSEVKNTKSGVWNTIIKDTSNSTSPLCVVNHVSMISYYDILICCHPRDFKIKYNLL